MQGGSMGRPFLFRGMPPDAGRTFGPYPATIALVSPRWRAQRARPGDLAARTFASLLPAQTGLSVREMQPAAPHIFCQIEKLTGETMNAWTSRAFTRAEAAKLCGIHIKSVDLLIHRARHVSVLFCEKRGSRRWFSLRDIAVLRIAFELERAGRTWLTAIGAAFDNLEHPPDPDALLIAPAVIRRGCGLPYIATMPPAVFERSEIIVPIGRIVSDILKEAEHVAV